MSKRSLSYLFSFLLSIIFLYIAFYNVNFGDVLEVVSHASIFWILILIVSSLLAHYLRAYRWKIILSSVKPDISMNNLFGSLMVGYAVNCVVPRLGEIARAVLIGKWENLSRSSMFGAIILERIIDVLFLCLSIFISALIWSEDLYFKLPWLKTSLYISLFGIVALTIFLFLVIRYKENFYGVLVGLMSKVSEKYAHKTAHIFEMLIQGFKSLKGTKNYVLTFLLSIIIMALYAYTSYIGFFTLGMNSIKPVSYQMAWILMSISGIGVLIPTPNGTGSYHTLIKTALVMLFGFSEVISLSYAFLTHFISYILFIVVGLISFLILNKQHENLLKLVKTEVDEL
jgi:glycosyltransferase 2 family protein